MNRKAYMQPMTEVTVMRMEGILTGSGDSISTITPDLQVTSYEPQHGDDCD